MWYIRTMKRLGKIAVGFAGGLLFNVGVCAPNPAATPNPPLSRAAALRIPSPNSSMASAPNNPSPEALSSDVPYSMIAARNVFGLVAPEPTPDPNAKPEVALPKITPEGIMGVFGKYQALFKVAPVKPDPKAKEEFYILGEGQMQDDIEVIKIDNAKSLVTFDNHGTTQELPLVSAPSSGGPGPASGPAGGPGVGIPPLLPGGPGAGGNATTTIIPFGVNAANNPRQANGNPGSNGGGPGGANPGLNFFGRPAPSNLGPAENLPPISADNQMIINAAQHLKAIQENDPAAVLYVPTPIDKEAGIPDSTLPPPGGPSAP